jgi:hypothetical protein
MADSKVKTQLIIEGKNTSQKAFAEADASFDKLSKTAVSAGAVIGASLAVSATAFAAWVKSSIDAIDKTDELAERTGFLSSQFAGLQYAAKFASMGPEDLAASLTKFNQTISKAAGGSKAQVATFGSLGISIRDAAGNIKSADSLFSEVADRFEKMPDGVQKSALALQLFGKSGAKLLPILNMGAAGLQELKDKAEELGLVLSEADYKSAAAFNDSLDVLGSTADGVGNKIAIGLLPTLNTLTGLLLDFKNDADGAATSAGFLGGALKVITTAGIALSAAFQFVGTYLGALAAQAAAVMKGQFQGAADISQDSTAEMASNIEKAMSRINKIWSDEYAKEGAMEVERQIKKKKANEEIVSDQQQYVDEIKSLNAELVKDATAKSKSIIASQKTEITALKKLKQDRVDIEARYTKAMASFSTASGDPGGSYSAAQDLKISARDALNKGDFKTAEQQAQAALEMLSNLASAGENTYGFKGVAEELKAIELAANGVAQSEAERKILNMGLAATQLKDQLDDLKEVNISVNLPPEQIAAAVAQATALAATLGKTLVIPVQVTPVANTAAIAAGTDAGTAAVPGYATGTNSAPPGMAWVGENGPELMQMGGGERIYPADISRRIASRMAGLNIPSVLDSTSAAAAAVTPASGRDLGTVHLNVGGQAVMLQGEADALNQIQMLRVKRGRNRT